MSSNTLVACILNVALVGPALAANFTCTGKPVEIHSIALGMTLKQVRGRLGLGVLVNRSPDADAERQYYYSWRLGTGKLDVVFDKEMKAVQVGIGSRRPYPVYDNVTLNRDTIGSIQRKLGEPSSKVGPAYGEGEYTFYSLGYHCGPESGEQVLFMSELDCNRPDMEVCLSEKLFVTRPLLKISIQKRNEPSAR